MSQLDIAIDDRVPIATVSERVIQLERGNLSFSSSNPSAPVTSVFIKTVPHTQAWSKHFEHQRTIGALCPDVERILSVTEVQGGLPGSAASSPALQAVLPLAVSLEARVAEHGALNPLEGLRLLLRLSQALASLHALASTPHLNLHPRNVLFVPRGSVAPPLAAKPTSDALSDSGPAAVGPDGEPSSPSGRIQELTQEEADRQLALRLQRQFEREDRGLRARSRSRSGSPDVRRRQSEIEADARRRDPAVPLWETHCVTLSDMAPLGDGEASLAAQPAFRETFAAPEVRHGGSGSSPGDRSSGFRADLYSCVMVSIYAWTGKLPPYKRDGVATGSDTATHPAAALIPAALSKGLKDLLASCLSDDPSLRPASAAPLNAAVSDELEALGLVAGAGGGGGRNLSEAVAIAISQGEYRRAALLSECGGAELKVDTLRRWVDGWGRWGPRRFREMCAAGLTKVVQVLLDLEHVTNALDDADDEYITDDDDEDDCFDMGWRSSCLFAAFQGGHVGVARALADSQYISFETRNDSDQTLLHVACQLASRDPTAARQLCELALEKGCPKNETDTKGRAPLYFAAKAGDLGLVQYLVREGMKVERETSESDTDEDEPDDTESETVPDSEDGSGANNRWSDAMVGAAKSGNVALVQFLCSRGGRPSWRPLAAAAKRGHRAVAEYLLAMGADPDRRLEVLKEAAGSADRGLLRRLVDRLGPRLNRCAEQLGQVLLKAALAGNTEMVCHLASRGVDVDSPDSMGRTALIHLAGRSGCLELVSMLIDLGAKIQKADNDGRTALVVACERGLEDIAAHLLDRGAALHSPSPVAPVPLPAAASSGSFGLVRMLIEKGAPVDQVGGPDQATALLRACAKGFHEIAAYLLDKGADLNRPRLDGQRPIQVAAKACKETPESVRTLELLCERGADPNPQGVPPLVLAVLEANFEAVKVLCRPKYGCSLGARHEGKTAVTLALEIEAQLSDRLERGVPRESLGENPMSDREKQEDKDRTSARLKRIQGIVRFLICETEADKDECAAALSAGLLKAAGGGRVAHMKAHFDMGLKPSHMDPLTGASLVHVAARSGSTECLQAVLDALEASFASDATAASRGPTEDAAPSSSNPPTPSATVASRILEALNARDLQGRTPLIAACIESLPHANATLRLLLERGADPNRPMVRTLHVLADATAPETADAPGLQSPARATATATEAARSAAASDRGVAPDLGRASPDPSPAAFPSPSPQKPRPESDFPDSSSGPPPPVTAVEVRTSPLIACVLHKASSAGLECVKLLIEHHADVNFSDEGNGLTALHHAVRLGRRSIIAVLLAAGADPSLPAVGWGSESHWRGLNALETAVAGGRPMTAMMLLKAARARGPGYLDLNHVVGEGRHRGKSVLTMAVEQGLTKVTLALLSAGARVQETPVPSPLALLCLRIAAHSGPLTRRTVRPWTGADSPEKKETADEGESEAEAEAASDSEQVTSSESDTGSDAGAESDSSDSDDDADVDSDLVRQATAGSGSGPREEDGGSASRGRRRVRRNRGSGGADSDRSQSRDSSPTPSEMEPGLETDDIVWVDDGVKMVRALLKAGADPNAPLGPDSPYPSPLLAAVGAGRRSLVAMLLRRGAEVDTPRDPRLQRTPLMVAAANRNSGICGLLLRYGADVSLKDAAGGTALHRAAAVGSLPTIRKLLAAGATRLLDEVEGPAGFTPMHLAARNGNYRVVQLLIEARADPRIKCAARGCTALDLVKGPASRGIRSALRVRAVFEDPLIQTVVPKAPKVASPAQAEQPAAASEPSSSSPKKFDDTQVPPHESPTRQSQQDKAETSGDPDEASVAALADVLSHLAAERVVEAAERFEVYLASRSGAEGKSGALPAAGLKLPPDLVEWLTQENGVSRLVTVSARESDAICKLFAHLMDSYPIRPSAPASLRPLDALHRMPEDEPFEKWGRFNTRTAIMAAAAFGGVDMCAILLNAGADPARRDPFGRNAAHWAARFNSETIMTLYAKHPALFQVRCGRGWLPVHYASAYGNVPALTVLQGITPGIRTAKAAGGLLPIHVAAVFGQPSALKYMLSLLAPPNGTAKTERGWTALDMATHHPEPSASRAFLAAARAFLEEKFPPRRRSVALSSARAGEARELPQLPMEPVPSIAVGPSNAGGMAADAARPSLSPGATITPSQPRPPPFIHTAAYAALSGLIGSALMWRILLPPLQLPPLPDSILQRLPDAVPEAAAALRTRRWNKARLLMEAPGFPTERLGAELGPAWAAAAVSDLVEAARRGESDLVRLLVGATVDPTAWAAGPTGPVGSASSLGPGNALSVAAAAGHVDMVSYLIPVVECLRSMGEWKGWDDGNALGNTVLHFAAVGGSVPVIEALLGPIKTSSPTAINARNCKGRTPLFLACLCKGNAEVVRALIRAGADASIPEHPEADPSVGRLSPIPARTCLPIHCAAQIGDAEALRLLIDEGGADPEAQFDNARGTWTPLLIAASMGHEACARLLLEDAAMRGLSQQRSAVLLAAFATAVSKGHLGVATAILETLESGAMAPSFFGLEGIESNGKGEKRASAAGPGSRDRIMSWWEPSDPAAWERAAQVALRAGLEGTASRLRDLGRRRLGGEVQVQL